MRRFCLAMRYLWASPATSVGFLFGAIALCTGTTVRFAGGVRHPHRNNCFERQVYARAR